MLAVTLPAAGLHVVEESIDGFFTLQLDPFTAIYLVEARLEAGTQVPSAALQLVKHAHRFANQFVLGGVFSRRQFAGYERFKIGRKYGKHGILIFPAGL